MYIQNWLRCVAVCVCQRLGPTISSHVKSFLQNLESFRSCYQSVWNEHVIMDLFINVFILNSLTNLWIPVKSTHIRIKTLGIEGVITHSDASQLISNNLGLPFTGSSFALPFIYSKYNSLITLYVTI